MLRDQASGVIMKTVWLQQADRYTLVKLILAFAALSTITLEFIGKDKR